jgi:hypothetical protein
VAPKKQSLIAHYEAQGSALVVPTFLKVNIKYSSAVDSKA